MINSRVDFIVNNKTQLASMPITDNAFALCIFVTIFTPKGEPGLFHVTGTEAYAEVKERHGEPNTTIYGPMYTDLLDHLQAGGEAVYINMGRPEPIETTPITVVTDPSNKAPRVFYDASADKSTGCMVSGGVLVKPDGSIKTLATDILPDVSDIPIVKFLTVQVNANGVPNCINNHKLITSDDDFKEWVLLDIVSSEIHIDPLRTLTKANTIHEGPLDPTLDASKIPDRITLSRVLALYDTPTGKCIVGDLIQGNGHIVSYDPANPPADDYEALLTKITYPLLPADIHYDYSDYDFGIDIPATVKPLDIVTTDFFIRHTLMSSILNPIIDTDIVNLKMVSGVCIGIMEDGHAEMVDNVFELDSTDMVAAGINIQSYVFNRDIEDLSAKGLEIAEFIKKNISSTFGYPNKIYDTVSLYTDPTEYNYDPATPDKVLAIKPNIPALVPMEVSMGGVTSWDTIHATPGFVTYDATGKCDVSDVSRLHKFNVSSPFKKVDGTYAIGLYDTYGSLCDQATMVFAAITENDTLIDPYSLFPTVDSTTIIKDISIGSKMSSLTLADGSLVISPASVANKLALTTVDPIEKVYIPKSDIVIDYYDAGTSAESIAIYAIDNKYNVLTKAYPTEIAALNIAINDGTYNEYLVPASTEAEELSYGPIDLSAGSVNESRIADAYNGVGYTELYSTDYAPFDVVVDYGATAKVKLAMAGLVAKRPTALGLMNLDTSIRSADKLVNNVAPGVRYNDEDIFVFAENKLVLDTSINQMVRRPVTTTITNMINTWFHNQMSGTMSELPNGLGNDLNQYNIRPMIMKKIHKEALTTARINYFSLCEQGMRLDAELCNIQTLESPMFKLFNRLILHRMVRNIYDFLEGKRHLMKNIAGGTSLAMDQIADDVNSILQSSFGNLVSSISYTVEYASDSDADKGIITDKLTYTPLNSEDNHEVIINALRD